MKLLFGVWGNYKGWSKVTYVYNNCNNEAKTTLPLLLKSISPDKCFIIISDTLIENVIGNLTDNDYENYIKEIKNSTYQFIAESGVSDKEKSICEISILPGIGTFNKTKFIGNPSNFYSILYYELVNRLIDIISNNNEGDNFEFYLDITHGINYMTMLTYRALKEISQILAFFYNVKFIVLNSDPKVGSESNKLYINNIEDINVIPQLATYSYNDTNLVRPLKSIPDEAKKEIGEKAPRISKEIFDDIYSFLGAFLNALPVFMYVFFPKIEKIDKINEGAKKVYEYFYNKINIKKEEGKLIITQNVDLASLYITILQSQLLIFLLERKYNLQNTNTICLSDIHNIYNLFKFSRTLQMRLEKEVKKIEENEGRLSDEFKDYGLILYEDDYDLSKNTDIDERNFFAHCGFGYNVIQIKKEENKIILKIKESFIKKIRSLIKRNMPQGA
ncbi:MAG TPA: CRISPR-associated CARF protein Csx1 [Caldisericia bacterium]|nr:CRISPR-associated CARF protein Csx1 [Caldisericia bacterium]HPO29172.1 CRISPR-associated CARF protein Csx1 [Caldisericia bacterium]